MIVLIVDDSLTVRMDLDEAFRSAGWKTHLCSSAEEARDCLSGNHVDAIILDVLLPDGNGIDLIAEFRKDSRTARVPIILLSTELDVDAGRPGMSFAPDEYVGKPYDRAYLVSRAEQLAQERGAIHYGSQKILAVDDSATYLHALAAQLAEDSHEVIMAASGEEALQVLSACPVDCILLDLQMPGLSGHETCRRIKVHPVWRSIPVIMLTGMEDRQAMIESFNAGADDFVPKSMDASVLRARLRAQLRRKQFEDETRRVRDELHHKEIEISEARAARELAETRAGLLADLQQAKETAERSRAEAELANRAKDHFLAVLSHELRTPLTPVVMGVSILQNRPDLDSNVKETLEMIRRNVEMEARLIDDLLDVTRIARGKIEIAKKKVDLGSVIKRAVEVCKPDIESRRLHFGIDMGAGGPYWVEVDVPRLQQVFWNLLKNAIKFTPHGGCVGIRCIPDDGRVLVQVSDSGIGVSSEALPRIFNAFEQAEKSITRQFGGLGLGLAISKALVELHGGRISAQSEGLNQGTTISVELPLTSPSEHQKAVPAFSPQRSPHPLRILLVDDHAITARMVQEVLKAEGYEVETAGDVASALELSQKRSFDLLLSDLALPDGTGHELLGQLRLRGNNVPAIALSGYGQEEDIKRSYQVGFSAHLIKPASREQLLETIAQVFPPAA